MTVKFKIVPVTRWQIIRVEDKGNSGGTSSMGEFADPSTAERVGKLLAAGENVGFEGVVAGELQTMSAQLPPGMSGWQDPTARSGYAAQANAAIFEEARRKAEQALATGA